MGGFILLRTGLWVNVGQIVSAKEYQQGLLLTLSDGTKEMVSDADDRQALPIFQFLTTTSTCQIPALDFNSTIKHRLRFRVAGR